MNVHVEQNDITEVFIVQELAGSQNAQNANKTDIILLVSFSVASIIIIVVLILICRRRKRRRIRKGRVVSTLTTTTTTSPVYVIPSEVQLRTTEDVTRRYQRSASNLSAKSQIYLVPFSVLPPHFDFSSREVEVRADYVILKDLSLLERYSSLNGVTNEAYEVQEPYNPNILNGSAPVDFPGEPYQKQPAYNPTFY